MENLQDIKASLDGSGMCKKILCAVLVTCPWYEATQKERGEQARHNTVFVVYMSHDNQVMAPVNQHVLEQAFTMDEVSTVFVSMSHDSQVMAPVNQHVLEQAFTMDEGWLSAVEMSIFSHFLVKGKTKFIELLYSSENSILYEDPAWERLRKTLDYKVAMGVRGFVEACKDLQDDHSKLVSKMEEIGGPVGALKPEQIILITRAGSYMYGLNVASSDVDYIVIYAEYTEVYHKLDSIEHMLNGQVPEVRCSGNVREFIMKIRTEPLEGPLESSRLTGNGTGKIFKTFN
ncbi:hypothetical protein KUTeg_010807 [Tegillarca granosa]|uniref:Polymerase nucleotidyl transferase domain-containing protein n=1 Tax=Tegillarca granosa TaxID=220873 RepID=A0ABQ9F236_TEGGR|nr:hypothetical protein KUTeg_010807 [Tegillarca granosa]